MQAGTTLNDVLLVIAAFLLAAYAEHNQIDTFKAR
jgi:hypothetical protein